VTVNGDAITRTWAGGPVLPVVRPGCPRRAQHPPAARRRARLGQLNRGCLLELGPLEGGRFLGAGDTVALEAAPVGVLENWIAWPRRP
jgi:hypothetical protein